MPKTFLRDYTILIMNGTVSDLKESKGQTYTIILTPTMFEYYH